jgi:hypothetical protein
MQNEDAATANTLVLPTNDLSPILSDAIGDCARARNLFLEIKRENEQTNIDVTSPVISFCNIGAHLSDSLEGSIETIGYSNNMLSRLG